MVIYKCHCGATLRPSEAVKLKDFGGTVITFEECQQCSQKSSYKVTFGRIEFMAYAESKDMAISQFLDYAVDIGLTVEETGDLNVF
jgi:hypothetical protein